EAAHAGPLRPRSVRLSRRRLMLPVVGLACGTIAYVAAPTHVALQLRIFTLNANYLATTASTHTDFVGRVLVQATCDAARVALEGAPVHLDCFDPLRSGPGTGVVRLEARSAKDLAGAQTTFTQIAQRVHRQTRITYASLPVK